MGVIQKAKVTVNGHTVTVSFPSLVTSGSAIIAFAGSKDDNVFYTSCDDDQGQSYNLCPDYGLASIGGGHNLQTQGFYIDNSLAGVQVLTFDIGGRLSGGIADIFIYEITTPPVSPGFAIDFSNNTQDPGSTEPLTDPPITELFPGGGAGQLTVHYARGNTEIVMFICSVVTASFTGISPSSYVLDTQGLSAVAYRFATSVTDPNPPGHITDLIFHLSVSDSYCMSADSFFTTTVLSSFCGGQPTQAVGNPLIGRNSA